MERGAPGDHKKFNEDLCNRDDLVLRDDVPVDEEEAAVECEYDGRDDLVDALGPISLLLGELVDVS